MNKLRNSGHDFCAKNGLTGTDCLKSRQDTCIILFQQIAFCPKLQGLYNILVIRKGSKKKDFRIRKFFQYLSGRIKSAFFFHSNIHKKYIRLMDFVQFCSFFSVCTGSSHSNFSTGFQNGCQCAGNKNIIIDNYNFHSLGLLFFWNGNKNTEAMVRGDLNSSM